MLNFKVKPLKIERKEKCDKNSIVWRFDNIFLKSYFYMNKHNMLNFLHVYNSHNTLQHIYALKTAKFYLEFEKEKKNIQKPSVTVSGYEL